MRRQRFWGLFLLPGGVWLLVFFLLPMAVVFGVSIGTVDELGRPLEVFGVPPIVGAHWENWERVLDDDTILRPILRSFFYAGSSTLLSLAIAYPVAYTIARYGGRWKVLLLLLVILPFWVNYLVRTYAWLVLLGDDGFVNGALDVAGLGPYQLTNRGFAVVMGLTYSFLPFMLLPIYAAIERIDPRLIEAGKDLYGTPAATFRHVTLPLTHQGILAGCVLNFLPGFGDFITADLLGGPGVFMIGNVIQLQFLGEGEWPYGAVLTFMLIPLLMVVMVWYLRSSARAARQVGRA